MMELNPKTEKKAHDSTAEVVELNKESKEQVEISGESVQVVGADSASDNEVFVSVKSINISGSDPDLTGLVTTTEEGLNVQNLDVGVGVGNNEQFNIPDIKSETRVLVPRGCSDSHIGEGEGFHSSRLSSTASYGSLSSAVFLAVGICSGSPESKNPPLLDNIKSGDDDKREKCQSGDETTENVNTELGESLQVSSLEKSDKGKGNTLLGVAVGSIYDVKTEPEETDIDLDTDLSIQVEHDLSVGNTEDFLDEELLEEYDEPDDELHRELEQIFETDFKGTEGSVVGSQVGRFSSPGKYKRSKYVDSATWTQEDDMPSPLSDLSPVQSPKKKSSRSSSNRGVVSGAFETGIATSSGHHQGGQFDHQYQYQGQQSYRGGLPETRRHHQQQNPSGSGSSRNSRSHHRNSRGIHQSQSNQRSGTGNSTGPGIGGEFIHHQPQHHYQHQLPECFTVSSQLLSREARLYENVPTTPGELETFEINYPTSGGSGRNSNSSKANQSQSNRSSHKNNGGSSGGSGSGGSSGTNNNHLLLHHHHSASNLNSSGPGSAHNSVEQLFSVSELLGPGSCLIVGGGPPSRTSWVDSGRESLSFDGENNNSGGSSRNLLLIPPPPPPPINYQGFTNSSIIMQSHHTSNQSPSHSQAHSSRKTGSRRDRLVRQKHAIDETFLPIPTNSTDKMGIDQGGTGGYLAVPSPRRGIISNNMIASNFMAAASSPISLQRHPPASQIMLQENKKNKPLMPCESPYGIMSGGSGPGQGDWSFGGGIDKKGQMSRNHLLRCRSPQRGRSKGKNSHNQSFDYGELPSHQMFPKRHLLTSRQLSSHNNNQGFPTGGGNGSNQVGNNNSAFILQPQQQHRSFPAGLFSGMTPKSCSMGDLTSSPNNHAHHNYQSFHGNGKPSDQIALCPSTAPLVGSLPLPPETSVTYEFSLAPQSGTLAPGWHLTAVQRGLAQAVPLAAAVARRRLPRPRTTRPRFGFTDKNEARRAKLTIVATAVALLIMSMFLVTITLKLAPMIDDMGSSSTSSNLSPTKYPDGVGGGSSGGITVCMDPYARRPSGTASYIIRSSGNNPFFGSREHLPTCSSPKFDSSRVRRSHGDIDIKRQISTTLSIPSRENSLKSTTSSKSTSGQVSPHVILPMTSTCYGFGPNAILSPQPMNNNFPENHFYRGGGSPSSNCLTPATPARGGSRSSSIAQSVTGSHQHKFKGVLEDHIKQKRQRKYVVCGFTFLVLVAVACVVISLGMSSRVEVPGDKGDTMKFPILNGTDDPEVRKENENLMRVIQQTSPALNNLTTSNGSNYSTPLPPLLIEDQDESSGNYNNNNNNNLSGGGQSLTQSVIIVDPGPGPQPSLSLEREGRRSRRNESESTTTTTTTTRIPPPPDIDRDRDESGTLSSSLIAEILLSSSSNSKHHVDAIISRDKYPVDNVMMQDGALLLGNSETSINAESPNIYTEQIISDSDIDENDKVRTSIVVR